MAEVILNLTEEEIKAAHNQYMREWRAKNKDKVKAANARYWVKYAAKKRAEKELANG